MYDGHGGDTVAHYVAKHFPSFLVKSQLDPGGACLVPNMKEADVPARSQAAFEKAIMEIDAEMRKMPDVESGQDQSGSTSVMALLSPGHIVCANTGDSRAVLSRRGEAVALSHDHKPYNPGEKERIEAAGSHVKFNRVNGDLAVSRALGDYVYKRCGAAAEPSKRAACTPACASAQRSGSKRRRARCAADSLHAGRACCTGATPSSPRCRR